MLLGTNPHLWTGIVKITRPAMTSVRMYKEKQFATVRDKEGCIDSTIPYDKFLIKRFFHNGRPHVYVKAVVNRQEQLIFDDEVTGLDW